MIQTKVTQFQLVSESAGTDLQVQVAQVLFPNLFQTNNELLQSTKSKLIDKNSLWEFILIMIYFLVGEHGLRGYSENRRQSDPFPAIFSLFSLKFGR